MLATLDNLHFNFSKIDGYGKAFNYVISAREAGKTVAWVRKVYKKFKFKKKTALVIRRHTVDITDAYIDSILFVVRKFFDENAVFEYNKSCLKDGVVYVKMNGELFLGIVSLNVDVTRLKSLILPKIDTVIFDEFIVNPRYGEKYLKNEVEKFKEVYNTYRRECDGLLKVYFCGNPYSRYNPYFIETGVALDKVLPGTIFSGDNWVIESYRICEELYQKILKENPLYKIDDAYTNYALKGESVNDVGIKISKYKNGYKLFLLCNIFDTMVGIFKNPNPKEKDDKFFCAPTSYDNFSKDVYYFELDDLVNGGGVLYNSDDGLKLTLLRMAIRRNRVSYSDIATYYNVREIYNYI